MAFKYNGTNVNTAQISGPTGYIAEGSPTLLNGILYNIDNQNYIKTVEQFNTTSSFSIILKYKVLADGNLTYFIGNTNGFKFYSTSTNANNLGGMIRASSEDEWTYLNVPSISHQADTWYILQFDYNGTNTYTVTVKNESGTVLGTSTTTSNIKIAAGNICFGYNGGNAAEEIDLNNTYIYINNKLWFWKPMEANYVIQNGGKVGYTIVGSPTITNGVVSNFSMNDYLLMTSSYPAEITSFEKQIKFTTPAEWPSGYFPLIGSTNYDRIIFSAPYYCLVGLRHSGGMMKDIGFQYAFQSSTTYILKVTLQNQIVNISLFNTSGTLLKTQDTEFPYVNVPNTTPRIGQSTADGGGYWRGSIDLNETYIKVNGEYFFNGGSKLIWANPHLYLEGPNTYNKVGSPSIVDNVVSGFDYNNYLQLSSPISATNSSPFKIFTKVTYKPDTTINEPIFFCTNSESGAYWLTLRFLQAGGIQFYYKTTSYSGLELKSLYSFTEDSTYYIEVIYANNTLTMNIYDDSKTLVQTTDKTESDIYLNPSGLGTTNIGAQNLYGAIKGSIDLNETYIILNGNLWFYGRNNATQNIAPIPTNYFYGSVTTTNIGFVDTRTQKFTELPNGVTLGNDNMDDIFPYNLPIQF